MCTETGKYGTYTGKIAGNSDCFGENKILDLGDTDFNACTEKYVQRTQENNV